MPETTLYRADALTQEADVALVEMIYEHVQSLDDNPAADEFYFLLTEAFERFAPNVELDIVRANNVDGPEGLESIVRRMGERQTLRLRARAARQRERDYGDA